jgi:hypothetical protein
MQEIADTGEVSNPTGDVYRCCNILAAPAMELCVFTNDTMYVRSKGQSKGVLIAELILRGCNHADASFPA